MRRKTLPKAIRPGAADHGGARPQRVSEPLPEVTEFAKARRNAPAPESTPEDDADALKARARKLVERFALWSGIAGLLPIPVVDLAAVCGLQIQMLRRLSQIYDIPFSKNRGKAIIAGFAGTMVPATTGLGLASTIKTVPVAGTAIGILTTPALAVGATYVIGLAFIEHFASGGTLLDFEPPDYQEFVKGKMSPSKT